MIKTNSTLVFLFAILTPFSSCQGQDQLDQAAKEQNVKPISKNKISIDSKAEVIFTDSKKNLWLASREIGVYKYNENNLELFTADDGLLSDRVLSVQEDEYGNLYFDTPEGVFKYDGKKFSTLTILENEIDSNNWQSTSGDMWFRIGWSSSGPYRYDGQNLVHLKFPKNPMEDEFYGLYPDVSFNPYGVYTIFKDSKGYLWFGTSSLGLYLYDGKEISWAYEKQWTDTPEGGSFGIRSISEDHEGNFWICNAINKYTLLPNNPKKIDLKSINFTGHVGIKNQADDALYFLYVITDNNGDLLMVTYESGIWKNDGKTLEQVFIRDGERNISPNSAYNDNKGIIWFGTENDGIFKYNGESFEKFE